MLNVILRSSLVAWICACLVISTASLEGAVPPPPRDLQEVRAALAKAPASEISTTRSLKIVLVANRKDHGPHEHDYPRWMDRWETLLASSDEIGDGATTAGLADVPAANMYGPPSGLADCPDGGAANVTVETARDWPSEVQFASADLIVAFMGTGRIWDAAKLDQVEKFLQRGGGFVAIHSAVIAEDAAADRLSQILGLAWKRGITGFRHGGLDLKITQPDNPITLGLPLEIPFIDETYWPVIGDRSKVEILATADEIDASTKKPAPQPMVWTNTYGKRPCVQHHPGPLQLDLR